MQDWGLKACIIVHSLFKNSFKYQSNPFQIQVEDFKFHQDEYKDSKFQMIQSVYNYKGIERKLYSRQVSIHVT